MPKLTKADLKSMPEGTRIEFHISSTVTLTRSRGDRWIVTNVMPSYSVGDSHTTDMLTFLKNPSEIKVA